MRLIHEDNLEDIAVGAAILGAGGGGDPYIGKLMAQQAIRTHGPVKLISLEELEDDDLVITTGMMGAPTVMIEKLPRGDEIGNACRALAAHLGRPVTAVMTYEAGGLNSTIPFTFAASSGLPLVDADGMGRAFPEMQMLTMTLHSISATPMTIADEKGNVSLITTINNRWTERLARAITVEMGGSTMVAMYAMTGAEAKRASIPATISLIERIGLRLREARTLKRDPIQTVQDETNGFRIFNGKIVDLSRRTEGGFVRGSATLTGMDEERGRTLELRFQNEHLVAIRDGEIVVSVPDLITLLDAQTGEPITTEGMRYGLRAVVLGIPCDPQWRTAAGLELVGPKYFGYQVDFVPVEQRFGQQAFATHQAPVWQP